MFFGLLEGGSLPARGDFDKARDKVDDEDFPAGKRCTLKTLSSTLSTFAYFRVVGGPHSSRFKSKIENSRSTFDCDYDEAYDKVSLAGGKDLCKLNRSPAERDRNPAGRDER